MSIQGCGQLGILLFLASAAFAGDDTGLDEQKISAVKKWIVESKTAMQEELKLMPETLRSERVKLHKIRTSNLGVSQKKERMLSQRMLIKQLERRELALKKGAAEPKPPKFSDDLKVGELGKIDSPFRVAEVIDKDSVLIEPLFANPALLFGTVDPDKIFLYEAPIQLDGVDATLVQKGDRFGVETNVEVNFGQSPFTNVFMVRDVKQYRTLQGLLNVKRLTSIDLDAIVKQLKSGEEKPNSSGGAKSGVTKQSTEKRAKIKDDDDGRKATLKLRDGRKITGGLVAETADTVTLNVAGFETTFDRAQIVSLEVAKTLTEQFAEQRAKIEDDNYNGRYTLARKVFETRSTEGYKLALRELDSILKASPEHQMAKLLKRIVTERLKMQP